MADAAWAARLYVTTHQIGPGITQYSAWHDEYPGPVGVVLVNASHSLTQATAGVIWSYTLPWFRRRGVRTKIQEAIFQHFDVICSADGTKEGGRAFMKASGYTFDPVRKDWYVRRPTR